MSAVATPDHDHDTEPATPVAAQPAKRHIPGALRGWPLAGVATAIVAAAALVAAVTVSWGRAADEAASVFGIDPGWTPWLLPVAGMAMKIAGAVTIGCLIAAAFLVPGHRPDSTDRRLLLAPTARSWLRLAWASAQLWAVAALATMCLTLADLLGVPVTDVIAADSLLMMATEIETGQSLVAVLVLAVGVAVACGRVRTPTGAAGAALLAVLAALPPAFNGHADAAPNHQLAVSTLILHIGAAQVWTGGLVALLVVRHQPVAGLAVAARRYSTLAACCFALVGVTAVSAVTVQLTTAGDLISVYGAVLGLKLAAFLLLGGFGWWHRHRCLPALDAGRPGAFARIGWTEVALMAATFGLAAGLARTDPPKELTAVELATDPVRQALNWIPDPIFLTAAVAAVAGYLIAVRRLRRGSPGQVTWPRARSLAWASGWLVVVAGTHLELTRSGAAMYTANDKLQTLALVLLAPPLLVAARPLLLLRSAVRPATRPDLPGVLEWLGVLAGTRWARALRRPVPALALQAAVLLALYVGISNALSLTSHAWHTTAAILAIATGCNLTTLLFSSASPWRDLSAPQQRAILVAACALHVGFAALLAIDVPLLAATIGYATGTAELLDGLHLYLRRVGTRDPDAEPAHLDQVAPELFVPAARRPALPAQRDVHQTPVRGAAG